MSAAQHNPDARTLARFVDGELSEAEITRMESALRANPELQEAVDALTELGALYRESVADVVESSPLEERLAALVAAVKDGDAPVASTLLMASADDQPLTAEERQLVLRARLHNTRADEAWHAFRAQADHQQAALAEAVEQVSFDGLADRVMAQAGSEPGSSTVEPAAPSWGSRLARLFRAPAFAFAVTAAIVVAASVTLLSPERPEDTGFKRLAPAPAHEVVASVDDLRLDPGYTGEVIDGGSDLAPVVWIRPDSHGMPSR